MANTKLWMMTGVGVAVGAVMVYSGVSALTYEDEVEVKFTFNPAINVTLSSTDLLIPSLSGGSSSDSNEITVSVSTNAGSGYYLAATAGTKTGTTNLVNSADSNHVFANLSSSAATLNAMPDNSWGYSYSTDNGETWVNGDVDTATAGYGGLPLDNDDSGVTGVKLIDTNVFSNSEAVKFKIGAKAALTQASGSYSNTVNFYAVVNAAPVEVDPIAQCTTPVPGVTYMQDITAANYDTVLNSMTKNQQYYLRDKRDEIPYCVSRLDDGSTDGTIWMTQNLRIQGTITAALSNFEGADFNVSEYDLKTEGASGGVCYSSNGYNNACSHLPDASDLSTTGKTAEQLGAWYNYASASAGTITGGDNSTIATEDICPANWHLPSYDTNNTAGSVNSIVNASSSTTKTAFTPVTGGRYDNGSLRVTNLGYWWASKSYSIVNRYSLIYDDSNLITGDNGRSYGYYIRCVR